MKIIYNPIYAAIGLSLALVGCSPSANFQQNSTSQVQRPNSAERLGTAWGDEVNSRVTTVNLRRASRQPIEQMQVYYADKDYAGRAINNMSLLAGKIEFSATGDRGTLPLYRDRGNYYLQGQAGQAYRLVYHNNSDQAYEIVASVDGLNVIDGSAASRDGRGYVLKPYDDLIIEGFRKNQNAVASFIFSQPDSAYTANTDNGNIANTGVIGTAIYKLYDPSNSRNSTPQAFPEDNDSNGYAQPPR